MKSRERAAIFVLLGGLLTSGAWSQAPLKGLILPGKSVAGVSLGSNLTDFETIFPKRPDVDEAFPANGCGVSEYHWVDIDMDAAGIFAYARDGKVFQISTQTPRFSLQNGIKGGSSEQDVKRLYPQGQAYVLLHSNSALMGGRDLIYWVDKQVGVAFELYWNKQKGQRLVNGIDIFESGSAYLPEGCISVPQRWKQTK